MKINPDDLIISVDVKAYEEFHNTKVDIKLSIDRDKYRAGVCIEHIPTGIRTYENSEKSQYQNRNKALDILEKKLSELK